jgi:hypothetical protein
MRLTALLGVPIIASLIGCSSGGPKDIPGGAMLIKQGGPAFSVTTTDPGTLYLRDLPADRVVFETTVQKGQRLDVDAAANRVTLDGQAVKTQTLRPDGTYQVFLKLGGEHEYHPMMNP